MSSFEDGYRDGMEDGRNQQYEEDMKEVRKAIIKYCEYYHNENEEIRCHMCDLLHSLGLGGEQK